MTALAETAQPLAPPRLPHLTVDWQLFAELRALGLTIRIVDPADLGACTICPDTGLPALPAQAVVVYVTRAGGVVYRELVDTGCAWHLVRELRRAGNRIMGAELPAVSA